MTTEKKVNPWLQCPECKKLHLMVTWEAVCSCGQKLVLK